MSEHDALLPFRAIHHLMEFDFRKTMIEKVFSNEASLSDDIRIEFLREIRAAVQVNGFKNANHAPLPLKVTAYLKVFEKFDSLIKISLKAWVSLNPELKKEVDLFVKEREWAIIDDENRELGFKAGWKEDKSFEEIYDIFKETHPNIETTQDDFGLMLVCASGRLPVNG